MDKTEFLKWNELPSNDRCMDIATKKYSDKEVIEKLLQFSNTRRISEYRNMEEPIKMLSILKLIDEGISMMQLSRVTGVNYSKIQKLKKGQEGKIVGLTYYN